MKTKIKISAIPKNNKSLLNQARSLLIAVASSSELKSDTHEEVVKFINQFAEPRKMVVVSAKKIREEKQKRKTHKFGPKDLKKVLYGG